MRAHEELVAQLAQKRADSLGGLSEGGFRELVHAVEKDPASFVSDAQDEGLFMLMRALDRHAEASKDDDLLEDDEYLEARKKRLDRLVADCDDVIATDPTSLDAKLIGTLALDMPPERLVSALLDLKAADDESWGPVLAKAEGHKDATGIWGQLAARPHLRLCAALSRAALDVACYRMAVTEAEEVMRHAPLDPLGCRHTCALAFARLEDEDSLDALDVRFDRQGSSWLHLSRAILLYKLGRMGAAKRALEGYARICEGGACALLRPIMTEVYLPDRPEAMPLSFEEATLAVYEADPIIMDVPDFLGWAQSLRSVWFAADDFARKRGFDW